jgi:putative chitinase
MITIDQLKKIMPRLSDEKAALYFPPLTDAMQSREINTRLRMAAFLSQLAHESADLRYMEEIASGEAYEGRKNLGNVNPGDGKRYKGRGPIQLTGRANYQAYGELLELDLINNPEQAASPEVGFKIAALYWHIKKLNALADLENMKEITRRINGGYNGLEDRMRRYELAKQVLSS